MTPRARSASVSDPTALKAPRILKLPTGWSDSAFSQVRSSQAMIFSRLVEGRFPRWREVLPNAKSHSAVNLPVGPVFSALRQAAIAEYHSRARIVLHPHRFRRMFGDVPFGPLQRVERGVFPVFLPR